MYAEEHPQSTQQRKPADIHWKSTSVIEVSQPDIRVACPNLLLLKNLSAMNKQ